MAEAAYAWLLYPARLHRKKLATKVTTTRRSILRELSQEADIVFKKHA